MDIQQKLNNAWFLKQDNKFSEALMLYNEVYNYLVDEAGGHARNTLGTRINDDGTIKILPSYFAVADQYLKRDNVVAVILNNMGVIFAEIGDAKLARKYFEESIKFTQDGIDYPNPKTGLDNLDPQ